jgi:hypothetical protein
MLPYRGKCLHCGHNHDKQNKSFDHSMLEAQISSLKKINENLQAEILALHKLIEDKEVDKCNYLRQKYDNDDGENYE